MAIFVHNQQFYAHRSFYFYATQKINGHCQRMLQETADKTFKKAIHPILKAVCHKFMGQEGEYDKVFIVRGWDKLLIYTKSVKNEAGSCFSPYSLHSGYLASFFLFF